MIVPIIMEISSRGFDDKSRCKQHKDDVEFHCEGLTKQVVEWKRNDGGTEA
jgi:hypothetical protein